MFSDIGGFSGPDLRAADPVYRRWLRSRLLARTAVAVVATYEGRVVGSAVGWLRDDQPRPGAPMVRIPSVLSVYVEPELRGRGIASALTKWLLGWARSAGYPRVLLHASRFGRSVYRRLGFERTWEMRFGGSYGRLPRRRRRRTVRSRSDAAGTVPLGPR